MTPDKPTPPVPLPDLGLTSQSTPADRKLALARLAQWLASQNVQEEKGSNRGIWIDLFHASVRPGLAGHGQPWCASVVWWLHRQIGVKPTVSNPAWSAAWFASARRVVYQPNAPRQPHYRDQLQPGDVVGFRVTRNGFSAGSRINHVEVVIEDRGAMIVIAGGNTSGQNALGTVVRDGDGFYLKIRRKRDIVAAADWITPLL